MTKEVSQNSNKQNKIMNFLTITLNGMAFGLFATLIIGTIITTIANFFQGDTEVVDFPSFMHVVLFNTGSILQKLTGAGIGIGIALSLKLDTLKAIVLAAVGEIAAYFSLSTKFVTTLNHTFGNFQIGDPLTIYLVVIATVLLIKLVFKKKTPVDFILIPLFGVVVSLFISLGIRYPAIYVTYAIQWIVNEGTLAVPFLMGIIVAVIMGMALTAPISSAAIAAMVFAVPAGGEAIPVGLAIASGAAVIGCCTQMVGFAVQSRKDNSIGMVISIGIGTSMLQFKNILRKPLIWLPTIITSAILGPISTCWIKVICMGSNAGMGTAGLVGMIGTFSSMGNTWQTWVGIFVLELVAPALLVFGLDLLFRKLGWIKEGDLKV